MVKEETTTGNSTKQGGISYQTATFSNLNNTNVTKVVIENKVGSGIYKVRDAQTNKTVYTNEKTASKTNIFGIISKVFKAIKGEI